jgi:hypothetical protein
MFLINGTNVGARLFINDKLLIDAYFPQDNILTTAKALLSSNVIHKLELQFYSTSTSAPRNVNLLWRDLNDPSSTFTTVNETYYSVNSKYIPKKMNIDSLQFADLLQIRLWRSHL